MVGHEGGPASGGRAARWARGVVVDWTVFVTRGLPAGEDRRRQVLSDLWEQSAAADRAGTSSIRLALAVLGRAARGASADLALRRGLGRRRVAPWIPLADLGVRPFDQTSGALAVLDAVRAPADSDVEARLLALGTASNIANIGFGGGSF